MRPPIDRDLRRRREIAVGFLLIGLFAGWVGVALLMHAPNVALPADGERYRYLFAVAGLALSLSNLFATRFVLIQERRVTVQVVAGFDALVLGPIGWLFAAAALYVLHRDRIILWLRRRSAARA